MGSGITSGTTAVLSTLHDPLCQDLAARFGQEVARLYVLANWEALEKYRTLAQRYACSWERRPHYRYAMTQAQAERLKVEAELLGSLGFAAAYHKETPLPFPVAGALYLPGMAQFHPLQFLYGLASGLNIRENTPVLGISNGAAFTERGRILARKDHCCHPLSPGPFSGALFYEALSAQVLCDCPGGRAGCGRDLCRDGSQWHLPAQCRKPAVSQRWQASHWRERQLGDGAELCRPSFPGAARRGMPGPTRTA